MHFLCGILNDAVKGAICVVFFFTCVVFHVPAMVMPSSSFVTLTKMALTSVNNICLRIIILVTCFYISHAVVIRPDKIMPGYARASTDEASSISAQQITPTFTSRLFNKNISPSVENSEVVGLLNDAVSVSTSATKHNVHHRHQPSSFGMGKKSTAVKSAMDNRSHSHQHHQPHHHRHKESSDSKQSTTHNVNYVPSRSRMASGLSKGLAEIKKANEHYLKVYNNARCKLPKERVVKVKDFYPDPSKEYLPSCTVLHRCGDDSGCCESDTMQCVAKKRDLIELFFYKLNVGNVGDGVGITPGDTVEKLTFYNDTECECQPIDDRPRFHYRKTGCLQCPPEFTLREVSKDMGGGCSCDCFDRQKSCLKFKRGREPLAELDRRCVDARRCHPPECEYGIYDHTLGRCPKKHEKRNHSANNYDHWWRFDGRE